MYEVIDRDPRPERRAVNDIIGVCLTLTPGQYHGAGLVRDYSRHSHQEHFAGLRAGAEVQTAEVFVCSREGTSCQPHSLDSNSGQSLSLSSDSKYVQIVV